MDATGLHTSSYQHALRVAYLQHLLTQQPKTPDPSTSTTTQASQAPARTRAGSSSTSSASAHWGSTLSSIGDVFGKHSKSGEAVRFPKDLIKVLGSRIDSIVKGSERQPVYRQDTFRACVGAFYGTYHSSSFQRQLKDNRKAEEIIINFVTTAQHVLRKRPNVPEDWWKAELMRQVALFVRVFRECLAASKHPPKELLERLNTYLASLDTQPEEPPTSQSIQQQQQQQPAASSRSSVISHESPSAANSELIRSVQQLFEVSDGQLAADLKDIRKSCTLKVSYTSMH